MTKIAISEIDTGTRYGFAFKELPLPPHQKAFWRGVLERAGELAVAAGGMPT